LVPGPAVFSIIAPLSGLPRFVRELKIETRAPFYQLVRPAFSAAIRARAVSSKF